MMFLMHIAMAMAMMGQHATPPKGAGQIYFDKVTQSYWCSSSDSAWHVCGIEAIEGGHELTATVGTGGMVCHDAVVTAITLKGKSDGDDQPVRICELSKEPIDVPAHMAKRKTGTGSCKPVGLNLVCMDNYTDKEYPDCDFDPSRYLLGPNGKGKYICHAEQK